MNRILKLFILLLIFISYFNARGEQPNIVLFIADDLTYWDIGCYGGQAFTPNIDKLAAEGMQFNNSYQAVSICAPTRMNLYTGIYPVKSGAYPQGSFVEEGTKSIPHYLQELGYKTALHGKLHKWMKYCGDKGHETEMEAREHQWKKETRE